MRPMPLGETSLKSTKCRCTKYYMYSIGVLIQFTDLSLFLMCGCKILRKSIFGHSFIHSQLKTEHLIVRWGLRALNVTAPLCVSCLCVYFLFSLTAWRCRSWRGSGREGFPEFGPAHPGPGWSGGHEGSGQRGGGRAGPGSHRSGREGPEAGGAGGENRSDDVQRWELLQTRPRGWHPTRTNNLTSLVLVLSW